MFGLFKKKEAPKEPPSQQRDEWKEFATPFLPDELSIVAVTDASGFGSVKEPEQELSASGSGLTLSSSSRRGCQRMAGGSSYWTCRSRALIRT